MNKYMNESVKWGSLTDRQKDEFTMYGNIEKIDWYFSDLNSAVNENLYDEKTVNGYLNRIKNREQGDSYGWTDTWLYDVLDRHDIKNQKVAIIYKHYGVY